MRKYFLTVDFCKQGRRGIFCDKEGVAFSQCKPFSLKEMSKILGLFSTILSPENKEFDEKEIKEFTIFRPLAEYSGQYGIALAKEKK